MNRLTAHRNPTDPEPDPMTGPVSTQTDDVQPLVSRIVGPVAIVTTDPLPVRPVRTVRTETRSVQLTADRWQAQVLPPDPTRVSAQLSAMTPEFAPGVAVGFSSSPVPLRPSDATGYKGIYFPSLYGPGVLTTSSGPLWAVIPEGFTAAHVSILTEHVSETDYPE